MKKILLFLILTCVFISCNQDDEVLTQQKKIPTEIQEQIYSFNKPSEYITLQSGKVVEKKGNIYVYEEDMLLSEEKFNILYNDESEFFSLSPKNYDTSIETKATYENRSKYKWPNGVIAYMIGDNVSGALYDRIRNAMELWENGDHVKFTPRVYETDYVFFNTSNVNNSFVGKIGGGQLLNLTANADVGTILHELGHVLCLQHEFCSPERDGFINIHWDNIIEDKKHNFNKITKNVSIDPEFGIDMLSIMMYASRNSFAINPNLPVLTYKPNVPITHNNVNPITREWERNTFISSRDRRAIVRHYSGY